MRAMAWMTPAVLLGAMVMMPRTARADKMQKPDGVEGKCNDKGGVFFPPNKSGVFACLNPDGSGVVCGGKGKDLQKCDSWGPIARVAPAWKDHAPEKAKTQ